MRDVAERVLELAEAQGFALAGIASARPSPHADAVRAWIADGKHGSMGYLEANLDVRLDPDALLPGAKSVIAVCDAYAPGSALGIDLGSSPTSGGLRSGSGDDADGEMPARGKIARYAWGDDYHKVLKKRLHGLADALAEQLPAERFRSTVDTAPALERELAAAAGLGWQGKNTMMIHPRHGSYTLLGLIVTTAKLPTSEDLNFPGATVPGVDHCANCTKCIDACPTDAIAAEGYSIDASRCVGYLTIEHREMIDDALLPGVLGWVAGCDICQEVCPYNQVGQRNPLPVHPRYDPGPRNFAEGLDLIEVLSWTTEDRAEVFRGSSLKRIKLDMIRRNALIVAGNVLATREDAALRDAVRGCLDDEAALVRDTARQVWARIDPPI